MISVELINKMDFVRSEVVHSVHKVHVERLRITRDEMYMVPGTAVFVLPVEKHVLRKRQIVTARQDWRVYRKNVKKV